MEEEKKRRVDALTEMLRDRNPTTAEIERRVAQRSAEVDQTINAIPVLAWSNNVDGSNEFLNRPEQSHGWGWTVALHPDDLPPLLTKWRELLASGEGERTRSTPAPLRWGLSMVPVPGQSPARCSRQHHQVVRHEHRHR
jgi:hypothetical protein